MADIQQHYAMFVIFVLNVHWVTLVIVACVSVPKVSTNFALAHNRCFLSHSIWGFHGFWRCAELPAYSKPSF